MWAIIIIIMKNFCSSLYLPLLLSLLPSLTLLLYSSSTFLLFLPACFSFSAMHFGQVRVKGSHSVYVASTCALPLPLQRTVALIANNNNNDNSNNIQQQQQRQPHRQAAAAGDVAVAQVAIVTEIDSANSVERVCQGEKGECCTNSLTVEECLRWSWIIARYFQEKKL